MPTDRQYTGQTLDNSTGLYFYGARYYDASLGRFVSPDTIVPDPKNPQSLNRYSYGYNNPLVYVDPTGHFVLFVGGMNTDNNEENNLAAWRSQMEQLHLDPTHETGEEWAFFNRGDEPQASNFVPMEIASARLSEQIKGKTDIKLIGHSRGGALVMEYSAEVAEGKLAKNDELKGVYSIDGALWPGNSFVINPIADERYTGGIGPFFRTDRYANLPDRLKKIGIDVDMATFDNKEDFPFTTHDPVPGIGSDSSYEWSIPGKGKYFWDRWRDAHGIVLRDPQVGSIIRNRAY
ncbi:MAG: hypothetical protein M1343_05525 [Chloroflexi bacterium]|nr:hypothetical protein [Chloroflexota bacterium]